MIDLLQWIPAAWRRRPAPAPHLPAGEPAAVADAPIITDGQARAAVVAEAMTWLGTPYHHHARIKGAGVDCAQILIAVYGDKGGLIPELDPGQYATDWHLHRSEEQYIAWLERAGAHRVDLERSPLPGDVALFKFGRCFSHGGIVVDDEHVLHAYLNRPVAITRFDEAPLDTRPVQIWSLWD